MLRHQIGQAVSMLKARIGKVLHPARYDWAGIDVAFIVSTGRTGTRKLASLLTAAFERVDARHEPPPDMFDLGTGHIRSKLSTDEALRRLRRDREYICGQLHSSGCDYYIESNNNLGLLLPVAKACFPDCRIVHVVRNGRDFVRSAYSKTVRSATRRGAKALVMSEDDPRRRLAATDFPDDRFCDRWAQMSRFERLCWLWVKLDSLIRASIAGDTRRALTVKFEDVFNQASGYQAFWEVVEFLGLKQRMSLTTGELHQLMGVKENRTENYLLPKWNEWSPQQMRQFQAIAGEHMALYGYDA